MGEGAGRRRGRGPGPCDQGAAAGLEADPAGDRRRELDRQGAGKAAIAAAAGVSESSVRGARARPGLPRAALTASPRARTPRTRTARTRISRARTDTDTDSADAGAGFAEPEALPVLPDPVPRDAERALARFGLLGEGAAPVFTPARGTRWPGCCSRCRRWRAPGCWTARGRYTGGCGTGFTAWRSC